MPDHRRRFLGQADPPLSAAGLEQAQRLAARLRTVRFDAVYSSDLRRALVTAETIAAASGVRVQREARLREIDTGLWEGLTFDEAQMRYPVEYAERERDLVGYRFPNGESFRDLYERVTAVFIEVVDEDSGSILVSGHRGVNRVLLCEVLGLPLDRLFSIRQDYGSVNVLSVSPVPEGARHIELITSPDAD